MRLDERCGGLDHGVDVICDTQVVNSEREAKSRYLSPLEQ